MAANISSRKPNAERCLPQGGPRGIQRSCTELLHHWATSPYGDCITRGGPGQRSTCAVDRCPETCNRGQCPPGHVQGSHQIGRAAALGEAPNAADAHCSLWGQGGPFVSKTQRLCVVGLLEGLDELGAEDRAQGPHREEESRMGGHPAGAVLGQRSSGHQAKDVSTTMVSTHVLQRGGRGVRSRLDPRCVA